MNAAGMRVILTGVNASLAMPFYQSLVSDGSISQAELDGTRKNLAEIIAVLEKTPTEKLEAMVAKYNEDLTAQLNKFNAERADILNSFRDAQIMEGYVTTVMAKSGIKG